MIIAIDASTSRTGVAFFSDSAELMKYFAIVPDDKLHPYLKIKFIVDELRKSFIEVNDMIIEGIYMGVFGGFAQVTGFELLARLGGSIVNEWINIHNKIPLILKATETRKLVGVKPNSQKCEIQVFIAEKYKLATSDQISTFKSMIEAENAQLIAKDFTKATWKKHMSKISTYIEGECDLDEDCADAILTGLSFFAARKGQ
jgi:hypothetical protein